MRKTLSHGGASWTRWPPATGARRPCGDHICRRADAVADRLGDALMSHKPRFLSAEPVLRGPRRDGGPQDQRTPNLLLVPRAQRVGGLVFRTQTDDTWACADLGHLAVGLDVAGTGETSQAPAGRSRTGRLLGGCGGSCSFWASVEWVRYSAISDCTVRSIGGRTTVPKVTRPEGAVRSAAGG